ncbi:MAG: ABC transporter permease subunit [ANME-2 cluster archaeon]|nr:ABC transporter permease subunit [ANME-2 cluster archaeon]
MNGLISMIYGYMHLTWQEFRYLLSRRTRASYLIFILIFGISLYGIAVQEYTTEAGEGTDVISGLETGDAPLVDIIIFMFIFGMGTFASATGGEAPAIIIPAELGITLLIIVSILLGINMVSRLAVKNAASTISREREGRTLYLSASTMNTRPAIYLAKLKAAYLTTLPMMAIMFLGVYWIWTSAFTSPDMSAMQPTFQSLVLNMVIMTLCTTILFASLGSLVSAKRHEEESAVSLAGKFTTLASALTMLWILLPIFTVAGEKVYSWIETLTMLSPITQDMVVLYTNDSTLLVQYAGIQLIVAAVLTILGIIVFIRQDIEY